MNKSGNLVTAQQCVHLADDRSFVGKACLLVGCSACCMRILLEYVYWETLIHYKMQV